MRPGEGLFPGVTCSLDAKPALSAPLGRPWTNTLAKPLPRELATYTGVGIAESKRKSRVA